MKEYPSISKIIPHSVSIMAFSKLDGSCIRAQYSKKRGFYKFGSRTRLLSEEQGIIYKAVELIKAKEDILIKSIEKYNTDNCVFFFEFYGDNSFAGNHFEGDEHKVSVIDVNIHKQGMLPLKELIKFSDNGLGAELLYHGQITAEFVNSVRDSSLVGMPLEGVVCKANNPKDKHNHLMFKIKSDAWRQKLKNFCGDDEKLFEQLS